LSDFAGGLFVNCSVFQAARVEFIFEKAAFDFTVIEDNAPFVLKPIFLISSKLPVKILPVVAAACFLKKSPMP